MVAEILGAWLSGSLALLADAGHMFTDLAALGLALFSAWFARQPASPRKTYGYHRIEILAALVNAAFLIALSGIIVYEAVQRLQQPPPLAGGMMFWVAVGGTLINLASAFWLHPSREYGGEHHHHHGHGHAHAGDGPPKVRNLNLHAAYLHILGDLLGSFGVLLAALLADRLGWLWADPAVSIVIALLVTFSAWRLMHESVNILLEGAPPHLDVMAIRAYLLSLPEVRAVHDLHVWSITSGHDALSAHVVVPPEAFLPETLATLQRQLKVNFGLSHLTIQIEPEGFQPG
jgi:cobalt-zinc-cadmium efflux system protein